jgi:hypothetical protein
MLSRIDDQGQKNGWLIPTVEPARDPAQVIPPGRLGVDRAAMFASTRRARRPLFRCVALLAISAALLRSFRLPS